MRDSVPIASYSSVCNVLRQWRISLIPTYRVYDNYYYNKLNSRKILTVKFSPPSGEFGENFFSGIKYPAIRNSTVYCKYHFFAVLSFSRAVY